MDPVKRQDLENQIGEMARNGSIGNAMAEWLTAEYGIDPEDATKAAAVLAEFEKQESQRREQAAADATRKAMIAMNLEIPF